MTKAEVVHLITDLLCRQKLLAAEDITPSTRLVEDLAMDSLDIAELFAMIQRETGRQSGAQSLSEFDTVEALSESILAADPVAVGAGPRCPVVDAH
jgi:acyl carrier protein